MAMNFNDVVFEASYGYAGQLPASDLPEIAFTGRSNVGKSSMINKLMNRKRLARVSSTPGKTATVNFFRIGGIRFADLPGYGYAKVSKSEKERWGRLMEGYFRTGRSIVLVFQLLDMRHPPTGDDITMLRFLTANNIHFSLVLTKCDKLTKKQREERLGALKTELSGIIGSGNVTVTPFSAQTGEGADEIRAVIENLSNSLNGG